MTGLDSACERLVVSYRGMAESARSALVLRTEYRVLSDEQVFALEDAMAEASKALRLALITLRTEAEKRRARG